MKVKVNVNGLEFFVPCGDGDQSLKWLSLVASQQYSIRRPNGRSRNREESKSKTGFFLPLSVQSAKGEELSDPEQRINEVFQDGAEVRIELQEEVEIDAIGAPVLSEWQVKSFAVGEASKLRLAADVSGLAAWEREVFSISKCSRAVSCRLSLNLISDTLPPNPFSPRPTYPLRPFAKSRTERSSWRLSSCSATSRLAAA
jgi:hypothetical protein